MVGGGVTEWLMVADCKSAGLTPYVGSNPTPTMAGGQTDRADRRTNRSKEQLADTSGATAVEGHFDRPTASPPVRPRV